MNTKMDDECIALIEESINFELSKSKLFSVFHEQLQGDKDFWQTLAVDERNHAALLHSGKDIFCPKVEFPKDLIAKSLQDIKDENLKLIALIGEYETNPPSREDAFNTALDLENSAAELHFQDFMDKNATVMTDNVFKKLNEDDKELAKRISIYMYDNIIENRSE